MQQEKEVQHVYLVGAKSLGAYGGYYDCCYCFVGISNIFGEYKDIVLRTRYWKDDSFAQSGGKAQELLNKQIVETSDLAVAVFWTKFGEPTEHYASGTEEEIETMISNGKQVFVYFLDKPISPSTLNSKEYKKIINFKKKYCGQGIYVTVKDEIKLESDILDGLTHYFAK